MKKLLLAFIFALVGFAAALADVVLNETNFPDPNFRKFITERTGVAEGGTITNAIIANQTNWYTSGQNLASKSITDLKGIEYFTALTKLSCKSNKLTSLDVSKNTALTTLSCGYNQLTSLDVSGCAALTTVYCYENNLTTLDFSNNKKMTYIDCGTNQLTTLNVADLKDLTFLRFDENMVTSVDVSKSVKLKTLVCYRNNLTSLNVNNNTELVELWCFQNEIKSIDVSNCTKLSVLQIQFNQIESIDLRNNLALTELWASNDRFSSIDVSNNTNLTILRLDCNNISEIDLSKNTKLTAVETNHNLLTKLDVTNNPLINLLTAGHNQLTDVNVSGLTKLKHFCISYNPDLNEIKGLSDCSALQQLYVNDCNFYTLDVSNNRNLTTFHAQNNHLIQMNGTNIYSNNLSPYDISYHHNDEYDGYGWGGTNQTRSMPATRENVDADGTGVKEWYVVKMPVGTAVPDGSGKTETFVNDASKKLNVVSVETDGVCWKEVDGVTYFYIPVENAPEKFSFLYSINKLTNKNYGNYSAPEKQTGTRTYNGFDGVTTDALLQVIITPTYPDAVFVMDGAYRSTFLPNAKLNSYKNTIALSGKFDQGDKTYDGKVFTISRQAGDDEDDVTDVATVALHLVEPADAESYYTYTVAYPEGAWAANVNEPNRWDNVATVNSGNVTDGINVQDYFGASTVDGGDKTGTYTYSVKEDRLTNTFAVPVYAATTVVDLVTDHETWKSNTAVVGYTLEEINSAEEDKHALSTPTGVASEHSEFYNTKFKYHTLYRHGNVVEKFIIGTNGTLTKPYYLGFDAQTEGADELGYMYGMHIVSPYGENSYGTNEVVIPQVEITVEPYDLVKSEYTFNGGSRYYSCLLNLGFVQSKEAFTTASGGYRVWRDCDSEDEEYTELLGRANDYMFYKNMDLTSHAAEVKEVGSQQLSVTNASGTVFPYTSGTFGSSATTPKASFLARAYYKASPKSSAANMKKAPATTYYYVAEALVDVEWDNVVTGVSDVADKQVSSVRYYDLAGHCSTKPFCGMNIVVTKYTDGSSVSTKILR